MPRWSRVLVKVSGKAFAGPRDFGFDREAIGTIAQDIADAHATGVDIAVVIGGGNVLRGIAAAGSGADRTAADAIGMLATVQNSLALQEALESLGIETRVQTAIAMSQVAEPFIRRRAIRHLEKNRVVIMAAGTGNPYFSTDTAAALRALEIRADAVLKATNVDGVYDSDPRKCPEARRFTTIDYDYCIEHKLGIMDITAFTMCAQNDLPIIVFDLSVRGNVRRAVLGEDVGTVVGRKP